MSAIDARPFGDDMVAMFRDDAGQGAVEYGIILCFLAVVAMIGMRYLAAKTNNSLANSANQMSY